MIPSLPHARGAALFAILLTAACTPRPGATIADRDQNLAPGLNTRAESVDGLTVGHRLVNAGQYELALKAYYRAAVTQGFTADVLTSLGSANLGLGRLGQSERLLRRAIETDPDFAPAWNNLGVVLMEQGETGEAERVFRTAFALDRGESAEIRSNLRLALAKIETPSYDTENNERFALMRHGGGTYALQISP